MTQSEKLMALRQVMKDEGVHGFIIPKGDEHQGEYVGPQCERLLWVSKFTGTAGSCIVLDEKAAMFVDGRYTLQVKNQVDLGHFEIIQIPQTSAASWVKKHLKPGKKLAFDPWLMCDKEHAAMREELQAVGIELVPVDENLVDRIWHGRPEAPATPAWVHPLEFAGTHHQDKFSKIAAEIKSMGAEAAIVTMSESVNWLFNIRGNDFTFVPTNAAFAMVYADASAELFMDPKKLTPEVTAHLGDKVRVLPKWSIIDRLAELGAKKAKVLIDPLTTPIAMIQALEDAGGIGVRHTEVTYYPKACKNEAELEGMRQAHIRDGVAVTSFIHWIKTNAPSGGLTDFSVVSKLLEFRQKFKEFLHPSFGTISGAGPNGAIIHNRPSEETAREIGKDDVYLIDSGGHYIDGSTDITRTLAIGKTTAEQRDRFTRVLKGHIALDRVVFPQGTIGTQIDVLARQFLWAAGLDYAHGTGHGVGAVLNIHEPPQRITNVVNSAVMQPGMILSNEPGYYKEGGYGIRIENLVIVRPEEVPGAEQNMLGFENITFCPIERDLIELSMMTEEEIQWFDAYHQETYEKLSPLLDDEVRVWLKDQTRPLRS